ncbi:MAG: NAD(P)/FAD-dependent oxidoreductase, partial [Alphaproteobacteria bacterium]
LKAETGHDVAFARPGGFHLCLSERELEARAALLMRLHNQPNMVRYPYEILERAALEKLLPRIGPEVAGASYCPLDGHCNSLRLMRALHAGMQANGARYFAEHKIERIEPRGGGFRLLGKAGELSAGKVVLAAGNGNARLAPMVGLKAPVRPQRGQIIVTEKVRPFFDYPMSTLRQTDEGGILIGDSLEEAGFDDTVGIGVISALAARAVRFFPELAGLNVVRSWAALRVMTEDGFPVYDQSASCPGAFIATCHSGVTLAANHALVLAPMLAAGRLSPELDVFGARRFDVPTAA